ncbi:MAG: queuosine precursor transporter [Acidobacteria bacterium]|nr:queuosine precursor transporter [Acidobacteriota bacterium]
MQNNSLYIARGKGELGLDKPVGFGSTQRTYKYYDLMMAAFVTVLLCAAVIGVQKVSTIGPFTFGTGILFFPLSYVFGDVLTEVYGYARSRRVIWAGFGGLIFAAFMSTVIVKMPPSADWPHQAAYDFVFGNTPRIVLASLLAFWAGEFANSFTMAKMKVWTNGRRLWTRTIGSTIVGEGVDSLIFYPLAFLGIWTPKVVLAVMCTNYVFKVMWEVIATPVTYQLVNFLKRAENEDYYDRATDFNPFTLQT